MWWLTASDLGAPRVLDGGGRQGGGGLRPSAAARMEGPKEARGIRLGHCAVVRREQNALAGSWDGVPNVGFAVFLDDVGDHDSMHLHPHDLTRCRRMYVEELLLSVEYDE